MANSFCSSWKSIQFTNENINENIIQTTVWFFGKQEKKLKTFFTTKSKTLTSRLKKRIKEILLTEQ